MATEAFQLLSRGGAKFDKKKFKSVTEIFDVRHKKTLVLNPVLTVYTRNEIRRPNPLVITQMALFFQLNSTSSNTLRLVRARLRSGRR